METAGQERTAKTQASTVQNTSQGTWVICLRIQTERRHSFRSPQVLVTSDELYIPVCLPGLPFCRADLTQTISLFLYHLPTAKGESPPCAGIPESLLSPVSASLALSTLWHLTKCLVTLGICSRALVQGSRLPQHLEAAQELKSFLDNLCLKLIQKVEPE